ncbi:dynein axonemal intermediate chain 7-like [Diretmus argenteus]
MRIFGVAQESSDVKVADLSFEQQKELLELQFRNKQLQFQHEQLQFQHEQKKQESELEKQLTVEKWRCETQREKMALEKSGWTDPERFLVCRTDPERFLMCRMDPERFLVCRTDPERFLMCRMDPERFLVCRTDPERFLTTSYCFRALYQFEAVTSSGGEEVSQQIDSPEQGEARSQSGVKEGRESSTQHQETDEEVFSVGGSEGRKSAVSVLSVRSSGQKPPGDQESKMQMMDGVSGSDSCESVQVVDLLQYTPLGGVFYWDVFRLPPQAKKVKGWEIRQILDTGLEVFPYPIEQSRIQRSAPGNLEDSGALTCPPVGVSMPLPDSVLFLETPHVARWDTAGKQWRTDGITDLSYEASEARISFKMDSFHTCVLMQDTYANLPFQSWELRPLGRDSALFTVNAALITVSITIQGNQCMLKSEQEKGLAHVLGKWMSGPALQSAMLNAGINIFVNEYTDKYVSSYGKDPLTEHAAYEQMALFSSACAFSWSQWNSKCGAEHLVMQACEHHGPAPVPKDSWRLYLLGAQRSLKLKIREKSEVFSPAFYPGSKFHSTFIHMLQEDMSTDGVAKTTESHYLFVDTVQSLLCATRPLMYS